MTHNKYWFTVPALLVLLFFAIANLPMQLAAVVSHSKGTFPGEAGLGEPPESLKSAGWPRVFYQCYDHPEPAVPFIWWSMASLCWNVATAVAAAIACGLMLWVVNRNRRSIPTKNRLARATVVGTATKDDAHLENAEQEQSSESGRKSSGHTSQSRSMRPAKLRLQISDLLFLTLLVALPLGYYQIHKQRAADEVLSVAKLGEHAHTVRQAVLPKRIYDWTPDWLKSPQILSAFLRTTQVHLSNPTTEQVLTALAMPNLRVLVVGGDGYDPSCFRSLSLHPGLSSLQISGRPLDDATLQRILELENLSALSLDRTNVTEETIGVLFDQSPGRADRLVTLSLVDSAVDIGRLGESKLLAKFRSLRNLRLPRPMAGTASTFHCSSLRQLRRLAVYSLDRRLNPNVLRLEISDCPHLQELSVDQLQKVSVRMKHLPQFKKFQLVAHKSEMRIAPGQAVPGALWLDSIEMTDIPKWHELDFYAADIHQLSFEQTPELVSLKPKITYQVTSGRHEDCEAVPAKAARAIIHGIAESDGLNSIDFSGVPLRLDETEMQPLLQNPKLSKLYLHNCDLKSADFEKVTSAPHLRELSSHGCELSGKQMATLITRFPSLQRWYAPTNQIDRLRVEDHTQIQGIVERFPEELGPPQTHLLACDALQLVNLAEWNVPVRLDHPRLRHLVVQNLPKLQDLVVNCPVPNGTKLSGLLNLRSISAGGEHLTDQVIADWHQYEQLENFRLYYTGISSEGMEQLLRDRHVRFLDIIGDQVSDAAIMGLHPANLSVIQVDGSKLTPSAISHLLTATNLQSLSLHNTTLSIEVVDGIIALHNTLKEIDIDVRGLTPQRIADLSKGIGLQRVGLQRVNLDTPLVQAILNAKPNFRQLVLTDAQVDPKALQTLLQALPQLRIQLVRTTIPAIMEGKLFASRKLVTQFPKAWHDVRYRGAKGVQMIVATNQPRVTVNPHMMTASQALRMFSHNAPPEPYEPMGEGLFRSIFRDRFEPTAKPIVFPSGNPSKDDNAQPTTN